MARDDTPSLDALRSATTIEEKVAALKQVKNGIIGHERNKAALIRAGIVDDLVQTLSSSGKPSGKGRVPEREIESIEDALRLQTMFVINSLATAGPSFILPLVVGGIITPLISILAPSNSSRLVLESLRTIFTITSSLRHDPLNCYSLALESVCGELVSSQSHALQYLAEILEKDYEKDPENEQYLLTLQIIHHIAERNSSTPKILVMNRILDLLASTLALWVENKYRPYQINNPTVQPKSSGTRARNIYPYLLRAIAAIVGNSAYRTARLISCHDMLRVFPATSEIISLIEPNLSTQTDNDHETQNKWGTFLPHIQLHPSRADSSRQSPFPPLASSRQQPSNLSNDVIAWLIHMTRTTTGDDRVATVVLLSVLLRATNLNVQYDRHLSLLIIPLLARLIGEQRIRVTDDYTSVQALCELSASLSRIVENSAALQDAAKDSDALDILCSTLKKTMDPLPKTPRPRMWSPVQQPNMYQQTAVDSKTTLGPPSFPPEAINMLNIRASSMLAMASLAAKDDRLRRLVIDGGAMPVIVDSLTRHNLRYEASARQDDDNPPPQDYYPSVAIAHAIELLITLSRSVGMLRTSLIDAKVALPVLDLARLDNVNIKIKATNALTNMLLQFSPMKESLIENGVLDVLCEHAKSSNTNLKISALWAIKHMVLQTPYDLKMKVLQELGSAHILSMLGSDESSFRNHSHLAIANVRGEKVDILNAEPVMELDGPLQSSDDEEDSAFASAIRGTYGPPPEYLAQLAPMKSLEQSRVAQSRRDDICIQHHTLDIIRNMLTEPSERHPQLVEQIFGRLGSDRFFDLLLSKIRPKPGYTPTNTNSSTAGKRPTLTIPGGPPNLRDSTSHLDPDQYHHPDIIYSTCYVLAHIANGRPIHPIFIAHQPTIFTTILPHFKHPDNRIRTGCLWIVCNVLWVENGGDQKAGAVRALEMRRAGIEQQVKDLLHDPMQDVSERAKYVDDWFLNVLGAAPPSSGRIWEQQQQHHQHPHHQQH